MKGPLRAAVRGAAGFGGGAALFGLVLLGEAQLAKSGGMSGPPGWTFPVLIAAFCGVGAIGIVALTWGATDRATVVRAALGFAAGFFLTFFGALFTSISLQGGGAPSYAWGAMGFGISFAVGGGVGTLFLRPGYAVPGALAFGVPGAASGVLLFYALSLTGYGSPAADRALAVACGIGGGLLPFVVGGAVLGLMVGGEGD